MEKVFISGSRSIKHLSPDVTDFIDNISLDTEILIGDANGGDIVVQTYLKSKNRNATVYFVGDAPRNNAGFSTKKVNTKPFSRGRDFYETKDKLMAYECTYGFVVWDGNSSGCMRNIRDLINQKKQVFVYKEGCGIRIIDAIDLLRNPKYLLSLFEYSRTLHL